MPYRARAAMTETRSDAPESPIAYSDSLALDVPTGQVGPKRSGGRAFSGLTQASGSWLREMVKDGANNKDFIDTQSVMYTYTSSQVPK